MQKVFVLRDFDMGFVITYFPAANREEAVYQLRSAVLEHKVPASVSVVLEETDLVFDSAAGFSINGEKIPCREVISTGVLWDKYGKEGDPNGSK